MTLPALPAPTWPVASIDPADTVTPLWLQPPPAGSADRGTVRHYRYQPSPPKTGTGHALPVALSRHESRRPPISGLGKGWVDISTPLDPQRSAASPAALHSDTVIRASTSVIDGRSRDAGIEPVVDPMNAAKTETA